MVTLTTAPYEEEEEEEEEEEYENSSTTPLPLITPCTCVKSHRITLITNCMINCMIITHQKGFLLHPYTSAV